MDEKDAYLEELHTKYDELNASIDQLQLQTETVRVEKKFEIQGMIKDLQIKGKVIEKMVEDVRAAEDNRWETMKEKIDDAWHDLEAGVKKAETLCS